MLFRSLDFDRCSRRIEGRPRFSIAVRRGGAGAILGDWRWRAAQEPRLRPISNAKQSFFPQARRVFPGLIHFFPQIAESLMDLHRGGLALPGESRQMFDKPRRNALSFEVCHRDRVNPLA